MHKPTAHETALLVLSLVASRANHLKEKQTGAVSRFRMSETTFKRLANRKRSAGVAFRGWLVALLYRLDLRDDQERHRGRLGTPWVEADCRPAGSRETGNF
jgi:hypothetical protein